ncbi:MAG: bacteriohemerythrin [Sulfuritalea sp.]|jgi:hemerythrin|nr:bacteriohemerythrin [Sulfuritalea sp.]
MQQCRVSGGEKEGTMKWDDSFAIGIEAIDNQHKKIFEHLLAIENSVAKREPWHILHFFLRQLAESLKFHLAVEESLLEIVRYPDIAYHGAAHAGLLEQMAELESRLQQKPSAESLVGFFETWFVRHVLSADREYAAYIEENFPRLMGGSQAPAGS